MNQDEHYEVYRMLTQEEWRQEGEAVGNKWQEPEGYTKLQKVVRELVTGWVSNSEF